MSLLRDVYFWRQWLVMLAEISHSIGVGIMLSFPSLLSAAILSPNTTDIKATPAQASTIAGSQGLAGAVGFCLLPFFMQYFGRKTMYMGINSLVGIGFLIFALANDIPALYAARIIQGFSFGGVYFNTILLAEYSLSKRRGCFITLKKGAASIGSLFCHSVGIYWTWREVAGFAIITNVIAIIMTFFWKESPSYLAMKGRYNECEKSYKWLYGESPEEERNLEAIISAQMERRLADKSKKSFKTTILKMCKKDFLIPFIIVSLLTLIVDCCGRYYTLAYIVQMLKEITGDNSIAIYCTVGSDFLSIIALICSCFIIRIFKRRQNLFGFGAVSVISMFLVSVTSFLKSYYQIDINIWIAPAIILFNVFIINVGIIPTSFTIISEIIPLEHKASGLCTTGIVFTLLYGGVMKFTPVMMTNIGVGGTFAVYGSLTLISLVILYFILIETKDKTLQEIEDEIKGVQKRNKTSISHTHEQPLIKTVMT